MLLLSSCAKLPFTSTYWEASKTDDDVHISYFDNDHKISCVVTNDSSNLYVQLESNAKYVQRALMRHGASVYIDTLGKRNEKVYLRYPLESALFSKKQAAENPNEKGVQLSYKELNYLIQGISPTLVWNNGYGEHITNFAVEKTAMKGKLYVDSMNYIIYRVTIPLTAISKKGFRNTSPFSVGIKIDSGVKTPGNNANQSMGGGGFAGAAGFAGAGMGGPGGAGRMRGGMSGADGSHHGAQDPVSIWFVTQLKQGPGK